MRHKGPWSVLGGSLGPAAFLLLLLVAFALNSQATTSTLGTPIIHEASHQAAIANDSGYIAQANVLPGRNHSDSPSRIVFYTQIILRALLLLAATLFIGSAMVFAIRDGSRRSATEPQSPSTIGLRPSRLLEV